MRSRRHARLPCAPPQAPASVWAPQRGTGRWPSTCLDHGVRSRALHGLLCVRRDERRRPPSRLLSRGCGAVLAVTSPCAAWHGSYALGLCRAARALWATRRTAPRPRAPQPGGWAPLASAHARERATAAPRCCVRCGRRVLWASLFLRRETPRAAVLGAERWRCIAARVLRDELVWEACARRPPGTH